MTEQEIKKWIEDEAEKHALQFVPPEESWDEEHEILYNHIRSDFNAGASAMYNLLSSQIQELQAEISALKTANNNLHNSMVNAEQRGVAKATEEFSPIIESQQKEIERLKEYEWMYKELSK